MTSGGQLHAPPKILDPLSSFSGICNLIDLQDDGHERGKK